MMLVMDFDVRRRGHLISGIELNEYTGWLATAVTEAMHHFMGNGSAAPKDATRYLAVSGAHILHMLRDTYADVDAGYFNVPRELLDANSIGPGTSRATPTAPGQLTGSTRRTPASMAAGPTSRGSSPDATAWPALPTWRDSNGSSARWKGRTIGSARITVIRGASERGCE